jgi:hypothetical protein
MPFDVDEANPADDAIVSQFPANERGSRTDIVSILEVDHTEADGKHKKVTLPELAADPSAVANTGFVYTKDDSADTELYYRDDSGNVVQITRDGGPGPGIAEFPTGGTVKMLFSMTTPPTGWTKITAGIDANGNGLRLVSGSVGAGGVTGFTDVFGSGKTAGATTLTAAQSGLPLHNHSEINGFNFLVTGPGGPSTWATGASANTASTTANAGGTSAASSHNHTLSLDLQYTDVVLASKD